MLNSLIEKLLQFYLSEKFDVQVSKAKAEFFDQSGVVDEESDHFELRMAQFLDWYLFTRENTDTKLTPVHMGLENPPETLTVEEKQLLLPLAKAMHSLFEFEKSRGKDVYIQELFHNKSMVVRDSTVNAGFNRGEVFEARVIKLEDKYVFTNGFCIHPEEASNYIRQEIKIYKTLDQTQKESFMLKLMKMRYKYEQYRHINLNLIYTNESTLRL